MNTPQPLESFLTGVAKDTWRLFRDEPLVHVLCMLAVVLIGALSLGILAGSVTVSYIGLIRRQARGEAVEARQVLALERIGASLVVLVLVVLGVVIGLALLVVPGLLFGVFATYSMQALAYENVGPIDAIRRSFTVVRDNFLNSLVLVVLLSILHSIGTSIVLGVLLSGPLVVIAVTLAYERLSGDARPSERPPQLATPL